MKKAFTMLELVFVIVVIGIVAMAVIPRIDRDNIYEMSEQVLSHIKYTQHLAMTDNVYRHDNTQWYKARWHIDFINASCGVIYRIGSDRDLSSGTGDFTVNESAKDPLEQTYLYNNTTPCSKKTGWYSGVMLKERYNIVNMNTNCTTQRIVFDQLGRPHTGFGTINPYASIMNNDCNYTFTDGNGNSATITVTAETGYSYVTFN